MIPSPRQSAEYGPPFRAYIAFIGGLRGDRIRYSFDGRVLRCVPSAHMKVAIFFLASMGITVGLVGMAAVLHRIGIEGAQRELTKELAPFAICLAAAAVFLAIEWRHSRSLLLDFVDGMLTATYRRTFRTDQAQLPLRDVVLQRLVSWPTGDLRLEFVLEDGEVLYLLRDKEGTQIEGIADIIRREGGIKLDRVERRWP